MSTVDRQVALQHSTHAKETGSVRTTHPFWRAHCASEESATLLPAPGMPSSSSCLTSCRLTASIRDRMMGRYMTYLWPVASISSCNRV